MATRKLQTEIEKVLKKVTEGVETFEEILEKIETTTNANQKEKYESDLKKEIKKLQRLRDQIKTWLSSNDIKDKRALLENRKLIEQQMERFKAIEKEMKTKAYSREGLIMSGRLDPKEKEKAETCAWVTDRVEALNIQIEGMEAELETLQAGTKKGKNASSKERVSELDSKIERHKWHQDRLELILRLLENGKIETDKILAIQEDVNYYVDEDMDPDFAGDEEIYADLNLEEEEDSFALGSEEHSTNQKSEDQPEKVKDDHELPKKQSKEADPEPIPSPTKATVARPTPTKKLSMSDVKDPKPAPTPTPTAPKSVLIRPPSRQSTVPRVGAEKSPVIHYATAVAANLPADSSRTTQISSSPRVTAAALVKDSPKPSNAALTKVDSSSPEVGHNTLVVPSTTTHTPTANGQVQDKVETPSTLADLPTSTSAIASKVHLPIESFDTPRVDAESPLVQSTTTQSPFQATTEKESTAFVQQQSGPESEIRLPAALADLAHSFEVSKERAMSKDVGFFMHQMLDASYQFMPEAVDTERPKHYQPKNPYPTPSYYPQAPLPGVFDNVAMFEKFDIDTLFFIFYYQQGTYQQYLAARELKKQSWRFHKKYLTWFQRHEEPKAITDDYEQGTYIYFDYEGAWCQRKKTDFRFEYKFLEDAELV
ncbi:Not1 N-terminal domain, CCR4-Not complex component-domain-containing protein [Mortierella sp. GBAus27b]|nr:general negative regulator of transcription subunit 5 [Mortierella sp. GBA43]KAI8358759.1 Not1 N-terminal domain, CCR4-Not complex component-domain-containing protein [Mortierella sp. GBAus27b]